MLGYTSQRNHKKVNYFRMGSEKSRRYNHGIFQVFKYEAKLALW